MIHKTKETAQQTAVAQGNKNTPLDNSRTTMPRQRSASKARWRGGKPKGIRGLSIQGEPIAKTVLDDRR